MEGWLTAACDYIERWIAFQIRHQEQPGCVVALAYRGEVVFEQAFGRSGNAAAEPLTPRHRFRVASHSKSFTAAAIMKLREEGVLRLDDPVGRFVEGLHPSIAEATLAQLLSHSAGLVRDGTDSGQFLERRPFRDRDELMADLAEAPTIEAGLRFKYSNHGYGLLGQVIEAITGEAYGAWIKREILLPAGLEETEPDITTVGPAPRALGHSAKLPLGRRTVIPGDSPTHALACATGFVSTARDLVTFFGQLSPKAERSLLSAASRREMFRRQWRDPDSSIERYYGLGVISGPIGDWAWYGHSGSFQGFITRTTVLPDQDLTVSVLTNAVDGLAQPWIDGIRHILKTFAEQGAPSAKVQNWTGRWWSLWGAVDLVGLGDRAVAALPATFTPFLDADAIEVTGPDSGRIEQASGLSRYGEPARLSRDETGEPRELWLGGAKLLPETALQEEMQARYEAAAD